MSTFNNTPAQIVETMSAAADFIGMNKSTFRKAFNKSGRNGEFNGYLVSERDAEICIYTQAVVEEFKAAVEQRDEEATKAAKFEGSLGKEGAWFVGTRAVRVVKDDLTFEGSNKACSVFIAKNSEFKCSAQKLRKALKNGQRCNGFTVSYIA